MSNQTNPIETINDIKSMMEKSSKLYSINGFAGVYVGILTLVTVSVFCFIYQINPFSGDLLQFNELPFEHYLMALIFGFLLFTFSFLIVLFLTYKKSRKMNVPMWGTLPKRVLFHFFLPLTVGGLFCLIIYYQNPDFVLPLSLIFYGMAMFNVGNFTFESTKWVGVIEMLLGLLCIVFLQYHILIWSIGFGAVHIGYGIYMHFHSK